MSPEIKLPDANKEKEFSKSFLLGKAMPTIVVDGRIALTGYISPRNSRANVRVWFDSELTLVQEKSEGIFTSKGGPKRLGFCNLRVSHEGRRKTFRVGSYKFIYQRRIQSSLSFDVKSFRPIGITAVDPSIRVGSYLAEKLGVARL